MPCIALGRLELGSVKVSPSVRGGGEGGGEGVCSVFCVSCCWLVGCARLPGGAGGVDGRRSSELR